MDNSPVQPVPDPVSDANQNLPTETLPPINQSPINKPKKKHLLIWVSLALISLVIIFGVLIVLSSHSRKTNKQSDVNQCIDKTFSLGSSGSCVSDIQSMVNFLETDNLNECTFTGAQTLSITGDFNNPTEQQVIVVQKWVNCYSRQEGATTNIAANGTVDSSTWSNICTYAYVYPKQAGQSSSPYYKASTAAGKNAGC